MWSNALIYRWAEIRKEEKRPDSSMLVQASAHKMTTPKWEGLLHYSTNLSATLFPGSYFCSCLLTAAMRGVLPLRSASLTLAPSSTILAASSRSPWSQASTSAVRPLRVVRAYFWSCWEHGLKCKKEDKLNSTRKEGDFIENCSRY